MSTGGGNFSDGAAGAVAADDGRGRFTVGVVSATSVGLSPRWVHYSGVSPVARAAAEVLVDMATMGPVGDAVPVLDRERLAYHVGVGRADKLAPVLAELIEIGFLTVYDGGIDPVTGRRRQRRDGRGRPVPDRFAVSLHPPAGYRGPSTLTEADAAFSAARDAVYRDVEAAGATPRAGRHTIPRPRPDRSGAPQVSAVPGIGGQREEAVPEIRGQSEFALVGAVPGIGGQVEEPVPGFGGQAEFSQVRTVPGFGGHLQIERSSISLEEREIEEIEPVPGGSASPPVPGHDERRAVEVRVVVRRLPWAAWAQARGKAGWRLSSADADQVQAAITEAITVGGISLARAAEVGQMALAEARGPRPVAYVVNAFTTHLARRVRALDVEPLAADPLPLPDSPGVAQGAQKRTQRPVRGIQIPDERGGAAPSSEAPGSGRGAVVDVLAACETCEARAGDGPGGRTVVDEEGRHRRCPACRPARG